MTPLAVVLFASLALGAADTQRVERDFLAANELALKGEHASAIALYEGLIGDGVAHEDLYLNLGNEYAEAGREVDAIIAYERGLRLAPGDEDLRANLAFLRMRIAPPSRRGESAREGDVGLSDAIDPFISKLPLGAFTWLAVAANFALFAALLLRRRAIAIAAGGLVVVSLAVVAGHFVLSADPRAVVTEATEMKEGPHERFKAEGKVSAGVRVRVLEETGTFARILRQDGTSGWVPSRVLTRV